MYKIIDMRLRPPYKSFATTAFYTDFDTPKNRAGWESGKTHKSLAHSKKSMELMIKEMDENHIVKGVVVARETNWGGRAKNSDLPGLLAEYPDRFIGAPHIQADADNDMLETVDKYIINGPCSAIYMEPGFRLEKVQRHASDEIFFPLYEKAQKHNIPIILQYGGGSASIEFYTPYDIYNVANVFPDLKIAISHGGWPQTMAMIHEAYAHKNVYLSPDVYFVGFPGSQDYVYAAKTILKNQIMFGSAFPAGNDLRDVITGYMNSGLSDEELERVLYTNAAEFFGLE